MANPNDNRVFRGHDGNNFNKNTMMDWPVGFSFQQALGQPLRRDEFFQQWRDQQRPMVMPYGVQGSTTTFSQATEDQQYSQPRDTSAPLSQSTEPTSPICRGSGWSIIEDKKLCHAWMRISNDPIVGINQKKQSLWKRIFNDFVNQHGDHEPVVRNQKACEQRFQHIRAECNKWSAALKKIHDYPCSGGNELDAERAAHVYFREQNNSRSFKLDHCWEILGECAKFTEIHDKLARNFPEVVINVARPTSFSASPSAAEQIPNSTREVEGEQNFNECTLNDDRSGNEIVGSGNSFGLQDSLELGLANEESPTATVGKRPPGRKASKEKLRARKQRSNEGHSGVGERLVKSIDDLHAATSAEWQRANQLNEEEQQFGIKYRKLQMIRERITIEREMNQLEKDMYAEAPTQIESPAEKIKRLAARRKRMEELLAQADALTAVCSENLEEGSSRGMARNLNCSFDDEADQ